VLLVACRLATQLLAAMGPPPLTSPEGSRVLEDGRAFGAGLASVLGMYFPITFTPPKDDPHKITQPMLAAALRAALVGPAAAKSGALPHALPLLLEHLTLPAGAGSHAGGGEEEGDASQGAAEEEVDHHARAEALRCVRLAARSLAASPRDARALAALRPFLKPLSSRLSALALADPSPPGAAFGPSAAAAPQGSSGEAGGSGAPDGPSSSSLVACLASPPTWLLDALPGASRQRGEPDGCYDAPSAAVGPPNPSADAAECAALARSALAAWAALVVGWATGSSCAPESGSAEGGLRSERGAPAAAGAGGEGGGSGGAVDEARHEAADALAQSRAAWGATSAQQERGDWLALVAPALDCLVSEVGTGGLQLLLRVLIDLT
jgi:hypothetical protein